jgi:undecaprenyl-diphosphatase
MQQTIRELIQWLYFFTRENFHQDNRHFPFYLTILISFVLFVISLNAFMEITEELKENDLGLYDDYFTTKIQYFQNPSLTVFFQFITHLGDRLTYIIFTFAIAVFFLLWNGKWKFALQTAVVISLSSLSNIVLKKAIHRERPSLDQLISVSTLSYPSGHAMSAMAFYGFLIYLSIRLVSSWGLKMAIFITLGLLIFLIGISRIYLGVHYPSDVLAGYVGGLIWVTFCAILFNIIDLYRKRVI